MTNRSLRRSPALASVVRMKNAPAGRTTCSEPGVMGATNRKARIACGKGSFAIQCLRALHFLPVQAVFGNQDSETSVDRVAQQHSVQRVEHLQPVPETLGCRVDLNQRPGDS